MKEMSQMKFYKVNALPQVLEADAMYLVSTADGMDLHVASNDGLSAKRVINKSDVETLIAAIPTQVVPVKVAPVKVVSDITARDALDTSEIVMAIVIDATGDNTVSSGSALYAYNDTTSVWIKLSEVESMDLVLSWSNLEDKPTSTVEAIDDAVTKAHTHANIAVLDQLDVSDGQLIYNGVIVAPSNLGATEW